MFVLRKQIYLILASTYANLSQGHIKQLQFRLRKITKAPTQIIHEYIQTIKTNAILGKPLDNEDITDIILNGLDPTDYKPVIDSTHARDVPISFSELYEKLINCELALQTLD